MHILVTNDDGPPSNQSSPYVHSLVSTLEAAGHTVSVCIPNAQRSWIGKAHMIGQTLTASYFRPGTILKDDGIIQDYPFDDGKEEWVLIDGTPASCAQIGLHHLFKDKGPIDLLLSGPNYGRNTTALFSLSSGTIGAALEGAVNGFKSIALSYAFDSREHNPDIIAAASRVSTRLLEKIMSEWPEDVHLYSINVPLRPNVETTRILYTDMIQNKWSGSSFTEMSGSASDQDPGKEEQRIRDGRTNSESAKTAERRQRVTWKWSPSFADVRKGVEDAGKGDGWTVMQGEISVTPLRANFWPLPHYSGEIKLDSSSISLALHPSKASPTVAYAVIDYPEPYVQPLILKALKSVTQLHFELIRSTDELTDSQAPLLQFTAYEAINFDHASEHPNTSLICAYVIRKALIRKHYLSNTVSTWLVKHPESVLAKHFKPAIHFELDFAEFLDEALFDAWDLNDSMERNEAVGESSKREWWILKPGMSDGGNGIRLFSTMQELQAIFEKWEEDEDEDEDEVEDIGKGDEDNNDESGDTGKSSRSELDNGHAMTSQLRHFIAQPYIDPPLLLPSYENRKFHIRTYVLVVGALKVYVYREMLALFAAKPYQPPTTDGEDSEAQPLDLSQHLTNTCFQDESTRSSSVHRFWALSEVHLPTNWQDDLFGQICSVTGEVFEAAAREQMVHFQALPNAFELFGVDFLVDEARNVWLLELNAYPDFKQTGKELQDVVVGGLFEEVAKVAIEPFFGSGEGDKSTERMRLVKEIDLGRR